MFVLDTRDRATLNIPGYEAAMGWGSRITDDNGAASCFSSSPGFYEVFEENYDLLKNLISSSQKTFHNPYTPRPNLALLQKLVCGYRLIIVIDWHHPLPTSQPRDKKVELI